MNLPWLRGNNTYIAFLKSNILFRASDTQTHREARVLGVSGSNNRHQRFIQTELRAAEAATSFACVAVCGRQARLQNSRTTTEHSQKPLCLTLQGVGGGVEAGGGGGGLDGWSLPATRLSPLRQLDATAANGSPERGQIKRSWLVMNSKAHFGTQPLLETPQPFCVSIHTHTHTTQGPFFHSAVGFSGEDHDWNAQKQDRWS